MKTKSIKSIAALIGVTLAFNARVLAGPGPQTPTQPHKVSELQKVAVASGQPQRAQKTSHDGKTAVNARPSYFYVSGPHGVTYAFRQ